MLDAEVEVRGLLEGAQAVERLLIDEPDPPIAPECVETTCVA